jgi:hypothetical protein
VSIFIGCIISKSPTINTYKLLGNDLRGTYETTIELGTFKLYDPKLKNTFDIRSQIDTSASFIKIQFKLVNTLKDSIQFKRWSCGQNRLLSALGYEKIILGKFDTLAIEWVRMKSTRSNKISLDHSFSNLRTKEDLSFIVSIRD